VLFKVIVTFSSGVCALDCPGQRSHFFIDIPVDPLFMRTLGGAMVG
jgi:hypothetical protein